MKRFLKGALVCLFALLLSVGTVSVHGLIQAQSYGRLINYVGIVRGATQRLIKMELSGYEQDTLVGYLDGIMNELSGGETLYHLSVPDDRDFQENLELLIEVWMQVKDNVQEYRLGEQDGQALLELSEQHFEIADRTVFSAQDYYDRQNNQLLFFNIVMLIAMLLTWLFIFWAASRKMLLLENTNKSLSDLSQRDPLTGVYQMEAFKRMAQELIDQNPKEKYAVVYTDFADFKYINDVFGYAYGDRILMQYGELLINGLREGELCGRVSADNFVLLLHYEQKEELSARQRKADQEITKFMDSYYDRQTLPSCCGICCLEDVIENLTIEGFLDRANFARKTVKNGTNPNYVFYNESIRNRLREQKNVESRMMEALHNREFKVYYQPKVQVDNEKIACAEALVRWQGKDGNVIPPDQFIPVFEQKFMINELDQYVFEEVCRWLRKRMDAGKRVLQVSVNVSRLQFYDQDFIPRYVSIRDRYRIPPELLEIEFTESVAFSNTKLLQRIIEDLRKEGFSCSIDDFGKGYSSLSLLKNFPFDTLKIDKFFFDEGDDKERDLAIVQGIVELVRKFHIKTVAEGIEKREQVEYLKKIGCDYIQGYFFYRPMPQEAYGELLDDENR